ncbi:MAG: 50S ribosomal protein L10 [Patescibacteria group bacterium]|jgi:large subunit ribosomal protein L10
MPKTRQQKQEIIQDFADKASKIKSVVFFSFAGLKVSAVNKLRSECRKNGLDYMVVKRTLLKRSLDEAKIDIDLSQLPGSMAMAISYDDDVAPARTVCTFAKDNEVLKVLGGLLENKVIASEMVKSLSMLPTREELLSKLVGSIAAPMSGLLNVLQGNLRGLVVVLNGIKDKKSV